MLKAQRCLDQLQKTRRQNRPALPVELQPAPAERKAATTPAPIHDIAAKPIRPARTETEADRQRDKRIAAFMQRPDLQAAIQANAVVQGVSPAPNNGTVPRAA